jgi:hypothetical protein
MALATPNAPPYVADDGLRRALHVPVKDAGYHPPIIPAESLR